MKQDEEEQILQIKVKDLRHLLYQAERHDKYPFMFGSEPVDAKTLLELAKTQFPKLEASVAKHRVEEETKKHRELEMTKRLLIIVAAICLISGCALIVFAPEKKEKVSYILAIALIILPLGAIGVQQFKINAMGVKVEGNTKNA